MKQKKEREKEISQWPWISMLPFGILAGYWGKREVRITAISEYGFQARLATPATAEQKNAPWELAFYDQKTASYQRILLRDAIFLKEKEEDFDVVYTFATEQDDYRNAVQRLALQYGQYIRWKMEDDDAALAEEMTGYPAEQDAFHLESLEEQKKVWFSDIGKEFKEAIGDRIAAICSSHNVTVDYAFQDINDIPGELPAGRTKPWGTGQAVLAAKNVIETPFIVINADD